MPQQIPLLANYVKSSLNLAKIERANQDLELVIKERHRLVYRLGENRFLAVFPFGVVVTAGFADGEEREELLRRCEVGNGEDIVAITDDLPPEDYAVVIDPDNPESVRFDFATLHELTDEKFALMAHILAQSVTIDFLESKVDKHMKAFERIHGDLAKRGRITVGTRGVMRAVGASGSVVNFIVGRLALLDKPDIAWEEKEFEKLFTKMRNMLELENRFSALRFKVDFIRDSSETVLEALYARRGEFLELTIIILIAVEILLYFLPGGW